MAKIKRGKLKTNPPKRGACIYDIRRRIQQKPAGLISRSAFAFPRALFSLPSGRVTVYRALLHQSRHSANNQLIVTCFSATASLLLLPSVTPPSGRSCRLWSRTHSWEADLIVVTSSSTTNPLVSNDRSEESAKQTRAKFDNCMYA